MSTSKNERYLDPEGLTRIGNLEILARQTAEGFLTGRHRSPYHGFSVEYLDHRVYTPGDEPRAIDWKLLARTDKYHVKLFEDETNLRAHLILDCSRSMSFSSIGKSKLEYGCHLVAALAYLLIRQSDAVGLALCDNALRAELPPKARPTQFRRILAMLDPLVPGSGEDTQLAPVLHELAEKSKRRGLVILVSDLLDNPEDLIGALQHFRHNRHEVLVFHLLDPAELNFPYDRLTRFQDMEGGGRLIAHPRSIRALYLERLQKFLDAVQNLCFERNISYARINTQDPYDFALAAYLEKRSRLG